jgi:hypothetical protein
VGVAKLGHLLLAAVTITATNMSSIVATCKFVKESVVPIPFAHWLLSTAKSYRLVSSRVSVA